MDERISSSLPAPETAAGKPIHVRRVGALTAGLGLILAGVLVALAWYWRSFDFQLAARLSPLILVLAGVEFLSVSAHRDSVRVKYDALSVLILIVLLGAAAAAALAPAALQWFGPERQQLEARLSAELDARLYETLGRKDTVQDARGWLWLPRQADPGSTLDSLPPDSQVEVHITLSPSYRGPSAFASDCARLRDALLADGLSPTCLSFEAASRDGSEGGYILALSGPFQLDSTAAEMAALTQAEEAPAEPEPETAHGAGEEAAAPEGEAAPEQDPAEAEAGA